MKKWKHKIALVLAAALLICCLSGCSGDVRQIRDTLETFEKACRDLDVDTMLDCIEPDKADPIRTAFALYSKLTGQTYADVTDSVLKDVVYGIFGADYDPNAFFSQFSVTDVKLQVEEDTATLNCVINYEISGEEFARDSAIGMVRVHDQWYISYIDLHA